MAKTLFFAIFGACYAPMLFAGPILDYAQTNLVSSIAGMAAFTDLNLKNPWGIAASPTSPFWVADQVTNKSTLYNSTGTPQGLVVSIPGSPTGTVFNGTPGVFNGDLFLFATLGGTITGWRGILGTNAEVLFMTPGAVYTGLAIGTVGMGTYLYAADAMGNKIDVFPSTGAPALAGNFTDPGLPSGYSVYNIQVLGTAIFITYENTMGLGGIVDRFDLSGVFLGRLITDPTLDGPWGLALAPANFGPASGALLVGNEEGGMINAYNATTGALIGTLADTNGNPLINSGLWGLRFGNGGNGGNPGLLYFAAGINNEQDGLFGSIAFVPEPATWTFVALGLTALMGLRRRATK